MHVGQIRVMNLRILCAPEVVDEANKPRELDDSKRRRLGEHKTFGKTISIQDGAPQLKVDGLSPRSPSYWTYQLSQLWGPEFQISRLFLLRESVLDTDPAD